MLRLLLLLPLSWSLAGSFRAGQVDYTCRDSVPTQAFCLPPDYTRQDRPNAAEEEPMPVSTGFIIDDVSDVDDETCAVTLVLIMRFSWREDRLVGGEMWKGR